METALVTGASGFVGRRMVAALLDAGCRVRAGIRRAPAAALLPVHAACEPVMMDLADPASLRRALEGADALYHFAAAVSAHVSAQRLLHTNAEGTRLLWEAATTAGVRRALYCSSTAVYGLLARNGHPVTEAVAARAVEPYGRSKLLGERIATSVGQERGVETIVIRPTAIFGYGEHMHFGEELRRAAVSRILLGGDFRERHFHFVHVEDVVRAALHLMRQELLPGTVFNIVVEPAIRYEEAFTQYRRVLGEAGRGYRRQRALAGLSASIERRPGLAAWLQARAKHALVFRVWRPGFDMTFSSAALRATGFRFAWTDFAEVLRSCLHP